MNWSATIKICFTGLTVLVLALPAQAIPTFQAYIDGGSAGDMGADEDSWFTSDSSFDLFVVGSYNVNGIATTNLSQVTLVVSVPDGEHGTISIVGGDGVVLLTSKTAVGGTGFYLYCMILLKNFKSFVRLTLQGNGSHGKADRWIDDLKYANRKFSKRLK